MEDQPLTFEDIQINVPWGHIAGRWYGNRNVRPILALHGWQDNLGTWDRLIPLLPRHIGVLAIDFPGHGRSSKYPKGISYHVVDYIAVIISIIKEYKWKKVSLLSHSMGGIVSFMYAALYPHTLDMLIQIDIIIPQIPKPNAHIKRLAMVTEKLLIENERFDMLNKREPPSNSYAELENALFKGSGGSIEMENCKYILNRNIAQSQQYPEKYYFSRDAKIKYYHGIFTSQGLGLELAKRIKNVNYMIIKATKSRHIDIDSSNALLNILRENNPNFKIHEVEGSHHVHLNNPSEVAKELIPFILRHRPVTLDLWTVDEKDDKYSINNFNSKL